MKLKKIFSAVLPVFIGGMLYICFRSEKLVMFEWFNLLGIKSIITSIRTSELLRIISVPSWVKFSLPDALWLFSMISSIMIVWDYKLDYQSKLWLCFVISIGIFSEIGQLFSFVPGTFDIIDLILLSFASILPFLIHKKEIKQLKTNKL